MPTSSFPSQVTGVTVETATNGALSGDGSSGNKLAVGVDGVTIDVNGSNQLEAIGEFGGDIIADSLAITMADPSGLSAVVGTSGSLPAGTYLSKVSALDIEGHQTNVTNQTSSVVPGGNNGSLAYTWTTVPGAMVYRIWISTNAGSTWKYVERGPGCTPDCEIDDISSALTGTPPTSNDATLVNLPTSITASLNALSIAQTFTDPSSDVSSPIGLTLTLAGDFPSGGPGVIGTNINVGYDPATTSMANQSTYGGVFTVVGPAVPTGVIAGELFSVQAANPTGTTDSVYGRSLYAAGPPTGGTVTNLYGDYMQVGTLGGTATNAFASWVYDMSAVGTVITNGYYQWFDSRGVFRVREDKTFDSVGQAIAALYNPQFTKYTPGAADYERIVFGQWNGNVAEIGTEKGGTGTLRGVKMLGASLSVSSLTSTGSASGKKVVCVDTSTGQLYASSTGTDCSN